MCVKLVMGNKIIRYDHPRRKRVFELNLKEGLYKEIKNYEAKLQMCKSSLKPEIRNTFKNSRSTGKFIFNYANSTILQLFKSGFNGTVPNF